MDDDAVKAVVYKDQQAGKQLCEKFHRSSASDLVSTTRSSVSRPVESKFQIFLVSLHLHGIGAVVCSVASAWAIVQHATETVKVFINTPIGGATLGIITKQVVEQVCKTIAKQISESKAAKRRAKRKRNRDSKKGSQEINVVLYGPDGNKIDWQ